MLNSKRYGVESTIRVGRVGDEDLMAWLILILAGILEVGWAVGLKASQGLTKPGLAAMTIVMMLGSFVLLGIAIRSIPLGTGYTVWTVLVQ